MTASQNKSITDLIKKNNVLGDVPKDQQIVIYEREKSAESLSNYFLIEINLTQDKKSYMLFNSNQPIA
eukprot:CAMPEP_0116871912 /NCGR_PEP_ID=MMETSP0463-20121206/2473_1 /TAXON_ID=181622 /ORGANISM="Strombidinopsis sp, Strain SopsisLIS2011" /LENGTH=67 /DNA_ID=CAMNT_0004511229 /DNA_START=2390 /DNA_END=2593 /DNA_ORIENTATION=-